MKDVSLPDTIEASISILVNRLDELPNSQAAKLALMGIRESIFESLKEAYIRGQEDTGIELGG